jgi:hypothetical protein
MTREWRRTPVKTIKMDSELSSRRIASFWVAHRSRDFRIAHPRCETFSASMAHDAAGLRSVKPKTKHEKVAQKRR